jgi:hypothetical protein
LGGSNFCRAGDGFAVESVCSPLVLVASLFAGLLFAGLLFPGLFAGLFADEWAIASSSAPLYLGSLT